MPLDNKDISEINQYLTRAVELGKASRPKTGIGPETKVMRLRGDEIDFREPWLLEVLKPPLQLIDASGRVWQGPIEGAIVKSNLRTGVTCWHVIGKQGFPIFDKWNDPLLEQRTLPAPLKVVDSQGLTLTVEE